MRKINLLCVLILFSGNFLFAQTWDVLNKSMATYSQNDGDTNNGAWSIAKGTATITINVVEEAYVNFTKTGKWAWLKPTTPFANLISDTPYSIEIKARVNSNDENQISLRINNGGTEKFMTTIFLKHGDASNGYINTTASSSNAYTVNTSEWQVYRWVLHADHSKYDVYIDGVEDPVFENVAVASKTDQNGIYFGAESDKACNIDIEYVKMGTGDFFSNPKIRSVVLNAEGHMKSSDDAIVTATANMALLEGKTVTFSLVDENDIIVADVTPQTAVVVGNVAVGTFTIPAAVSAGEYKVKVSVPFDEGGDAMKMYPYTIADASEWDIVNKTMTAWDSGHYLDKAWISYIGASLTTEPDRYSFTQEENYVNLTKTYSTYTTNSITIYTSDLKVAANTAYTFEYKVRINPIDKNLYPDDANGWELNMLSARIENKAPNLYLGYDAEGNGYVTLNSNFANTTAEERVAANIGEWNLYRFVLSADRTTFDLYMNGTRIFRKVPTTSLSGSNILRLGSAVERARCNIDFEYAKMGTGDLNTIPLIYSVDLDSDSHIVGYSATVGVTVETDLITNDSKLLVSLIDKNGNVIVSEEEISVTGDTTTGSITIPNTVGAGNYFVKVAVPGGQIGDVTVESKTVEYEVVDDNTTDISQKAYKNNVSVSANILKGGQILSIEADKSSLSEVALYGIDGSPVYHQLVSGNSFTFSVPSIGGLYLLKIKLDNNTSKEFKILVK